MSRKSGVTHINGAKCLEVKEDKVVKKSLWGWYTSKIFGCVTEANVHYNKLRSPCVKEK